MTDTNQATERTWTMLCHLASLSGLFTGFGALLGPLIVWLIKKNEIPAVDAHGKEALNFNISLFIYGIISGVLTLVLIGFVLLGIIFLMWVICTIIASVKASNGEFYNYPVTIRFLK
jgi:uncharacterized Tic20 family protein